MTLSHRKYHQILSFFNNTPLEVEGNGVQYNFVGPKMNLPMKQEQKDQIAKLEEEKKKILEDEIDCMLVEKVSEKRSLA